MVIYLWFRKKLKSVLRSGRTVTNRNSTVLHPRLWYALHPSILPKPGSLVGVCAWLVVLLTSSPVRADPYTSYTVNNHLGQPVIVSGKASPVEACESISRFKLVWDSTPNHVLGSTFVPPSSCSVRTDTNAVFVGTVVATPGVCTGSQVFDYDLQACTADHVGPHEIYALIFTLGAFFIVLAGFALPWIQLKR